MTDESTPLRISAVPWNFHKAQIKVRSAWEEVRARIFKQVNEEQLSEGYRAFSEGFFGAKLKTYFLAKGAKTPQQKLQHLMWLEGECREATRSGFGYGKCFNVNMKKAREAVKKPNQLTI